MADYAKKKNDELAALCKERGLSHTGKKADLVKRLEEHDATQTAGDSTSKETEAAPPSQTAPPVVTETNGSTEQSTNETKVAESTNETKDSTDSKEPTQDYSLGLVERTLDEEIEKRKKRAAKFGLDTSNDETLKQLERAKRFGTTDLPGLLNQALPERQERKKRGREGGDKKEEPRKRSRQPTNERKTESKTEAKSDKDGKHPTWMTDTDREKAEKRKARFETKTTA